MTLTAPLLNQAVVVAFLVAGADKAGVLREVLEGPRDPRRLPAQLIAPQRGHLAVAGGRSSRPAAQPPGLAGITTPREVGTSGRLWYTGSELA